MALKAVSVSPFTLSRDISPKPSKGMEHQSPKGTSNGQKVSSSVAFSDLKGTLRGVSGGRGGELGGGKSQPKRVVIGRLVRVNDIAGTRRRNGTKAHSAQKKVNAF